ncbi:hypothetical protein ElyMa_000341000 [Elysia marginata]|uniref:C2H2-type domain-containing protein n=1 Tax=Elysia marginata TaxID=1093978 RepID=A0AAV4FCM1_9GAST|nr:hypothetical protein ElyMa_000341000 [Elysia marginata]
MKKSVRHKVHAVKRAPQDSCSKACATRFEKKSVRHKVHAVKHAPQGSLQTLRYKIHVAKRVPRVSCSNLCLEWFMKSVRPGIEEAQFASHVLCSKAHASRFIR